MAVYCRDQEEDTLIFEDLENSPEMATDKSPYELLLLLLKNIITRFTKVIKPFIEKIIDYLLGIQFPISGNTLCENMLEVLLLLPRTIDET